MNYKIPNPSPQSHVDTCTYRHHPPTQPIHVHIRCSDIPQGLPCYSSRSPARPHAAPAGLGRCCDNHERAIGGDIQKLLAVPSHLTLLIYTLTIKAGASLGSHPPQTHPLKLRSSSALLRMRDFYKDRRKALHKALTCTNGISSVYSLTYNGCF